MKARLAKPAGWTHRWLLLLAAVFGLSGALFAQSDSYRLPGGHLGVGLTDIDSDRASALKLGEARGVEVRSVQPESPADHAGIAPGDVLLTYNNEEILSAPQLGRLVLETPVGRKVKVQYWRQGKTKSVIVILSSVESRGPEPAMSFSSLQMGSVPDVPRMMMLWENMALGIECEPLDSQLAQFFGVRSGILIRRTEKGFAADKAGLRAGDVMTDIDDRPLAAPRDLISYLRTERQPGKAIVIAVTRDHKARSYSINLNE